MEPAAFGFNCTYLLAVAFNADDIHGNVVARHLLNAKANPHAIADTGDNCMALIAQGSNSAPTMLRQFISCSADVNAPLIPGSLLFKILFRLSRVAVRLGSENMIFVEFDKRGGGAVPLTGAAVNGKVADIKELLAMHADPSIANWHGSTALEKAEQKFKDVPQLIRELLAPQPHG